MKDSLPEMLTTIDLDEGGVAPVSFISLRDELRAATRAEHDDIENRMDLTREDYTRDEYGRLLQRYHAFYETLEAFLLEHARAASPVADFYCRDRLKLPSLARDLHALALECPDESDAGLADNLRTRLASDAHLLGALYVIEGSTLGGAVLAKQFRRRFDLPSESGFEFFTGYGHATKSRWLALQELLGEFDGEPHARRQAVEGARTMFQLFGQHLTADCSGEPLRLQR